jgi:hypothetical protein
MPLSLSQSMTAGFFEMITAFEVISGGKEPVCLVCHAQRDEQYAALKLRIGAMRAICSRLLNNAEPDSYADRA